MIFFSLVYDHSKKYIKYIKCIRDINKNKKKETVVSYDTFSPQSLRLFFYTFLTGFVFIKQRRFKDI